MAGQFEMQRLVEKGVLVSTGGVVMSMDIHPSIHSSIHMSIGTLPPSHLTPSQSTIAR
jgi:hypothetical protein